jgi:hypothetical protein
MIMVDEAAIRYAPIDRPVYALPHATPELLEWLEINLEKVRKVVDFNDVNRWTFTEVADWIEESLL